MKKYRYWIMGLALATAISLPGLAQDRDHDGDWRNDHRTQDRDRDHDKARNNDRWRNDHDRDNRWKNDHDRDDRWRNQNNQVYRGYPNNGTWGYGGYPSGVYIPNRPINPNGGYINGGAYGYGSGFQRGFQTGLQYGQHDRMAGKAFRPTDSQIYQNGGNMGGANGSQFRQGYQQGYQRGYYGR